MRFAVTPITCLQRVLEALLTDFNNGAHCKPHRASSSCKYTTVTPCRKGAIGQLAYCEPWSNSVQTAQSACALPALSVAGFDWSMAALATPHVLQKRSAYFPGLPGPGTAPVEPSDSSDSRRDHTLGAPSPCLRLSSQLSGSSLTSVAEHRATHSLSSSAVRAWRFPSSRRFLWDRTATGPCIHLHAQVFQTQLAQMLQLGRLRRLKAALCCAGLSANCSAQAASLHLCARADCKYKRAACASCMASWSE